MATTDASSIVRRPPPEPANEAANGAPGCCGISPSRLLEDAEEEAPDEFRPRVGGRPLARRGLLERHPDERVRRLGVGRDATRVSSWNGTGKSSRRGASGCGAKPSKRAWIIASTARGVDVAHDDDGHQVRAVPVAVEGADGLGRGVLDNVRQPDREALGVARAGVLDRELDAVHALLRALPEPPLLEHDAALALDGRVGEGDAAGPLAQHVEAGREDGRRVGRDLEHVDGLVERRVGVEVRPEARPDALEVADELGLGEALGPVEGHVLEQVREPALVLVLEHAAGVDGQAQLGAALGLACSRGRSSGGRCERAGPHGRVEGQRGAAEVGRPAGPVRRSAERRRAARRERGARGRSRDVRIPRVKCVQNPPAGLPRARLPVSGDPPPAASGGRTAGPSGRTAPASAPPSRRRPGRPRASGRPSGAKA